MKAFLDYISEITNEEPFEFIYIEDFKRIKIEHKGRFISSLKRWANHTIIYNKDIKKKLIGYNLSFFAHTIFHEKLINWRFV